MPHVMIINSPYYKDVSDYLLAGTIPVLKSEGFSYDVVDVSGALEIPAAIKFGATSKNKKFDMFIALGCVIRGETSHYDIVSGESARGLTDLALKYDLCIGNAILTCDTMEQALVRANPDIKNKGADAANAAISLYNLKQDLQV